MPPRLPAWEITPLVPLPTHVRPTYTYRSSSGESVAPGVLVRVPFGQRTVEGVVLRPASPTRRPFPFTRLKTIAAVISRVPLLSREDLTYLEKLALVSLESFPLLATSAVLVRRPLLRTVASLVTTLIPQLPPAGGKPTVVWTELAETLPHANSGQTLILTPEMVIAREALAVLRSRKVTAAAFAQTLPLRERRNLLERLILGEPIVVVASHAGVFLPLPALSEILVLESALPSHRQWDLHPRYDARLAAVLLSNARRVPLVYHSTLPSLDLVRLAGSTAPSYFPPRCQIIRRSPSETFFLPETVAAIRSAVTKKESVLVFHDVAGNERAFYCPTCGFAFRCEPCGIPYERSRGRLRCRQCGTTAGDVPRFCPRCRSPHIGPRRVGTASIAETLRHMFPDVPVLRFDRETQRQKNPRPSPSPAPSITVGTERVFALLPRRTVDRVVVLSADRILEDLSFDAAERFVQTIGRLRGLQRGSEAVLLQTTHPHLTVVQALASGTLHSWITEELADRQDLVYPPFAGVVRLERAFTSRPAAAHAVHRARADIMGRTPECQVGSRIVQGTKVRAELLLHGSLGTLRAAARGLPASWSADPHIPVSLLS